ncbi:NlpC/P60 family protein [Salinisphaera sp. T31B1]|uniref:C40 family peptidase n=1 Tax=Salinisphaera sp. T31B1 TaxID=727963 RepID=UPI00333F1EC0
MRLSYVLVTRGARGRRFAKTPNDEDLSGNGALVPLLIIRPVASARAWLTLAALALLVSGCASQPRTLGAQNDGYSVRKAGSSPHMNDARSAGPASSRNRFSGSDSAIEDALHDFYRQWQGVPYRYGGRGTDGIDCSSFVRQTMGAIESLDLPRTTYEQAERGEPIDRSELSPGDLVFFKTGGSGRHVGVYVGNGRFMHASTSKGVTISRLDNIYWRNHYWQSRRVTASVN